MVILVPKNKVYIFYEVFLLLKFSHNILITLTQLLVLKKMQNTLICVINPVVIINFLLLICSINWNRSAPLEMVGTHTFITPYYSPLTDTVNILYLTPKKTRHGTVFFKGNKSREKKLSCPTGPDSGYFTFPGIKSLKNYDVWVNHKNCGFPPHLTIVPVALKMLYWKCL